MSQFDFSNKKYYPLSFEECSSPPKMKIFRDTINTYHSYKKYTDSPTRNIRWLVYETKSGNLVGVIGLSSAVLALSDRDNFIGWNKSIRIKNIGMVANNSRCCFIKDNFTIPNIGSMALKLMADEGRKLWNKKYNQDLVMLETFVEEINDSLIHRSGAMYKASNWILLGKTKGNSISKSPLSLWKKETGSRGELARTDPEAAILKYGYKNKSGYDITKSNPKLIFVKPLIKNWKRILCK